MPISPVSKITSASSTTTRVSAPPPVVIPAIDEPPSRDNHRAVSLRISSSSSSESENDEVERDEEVLREILSSSYLQDNPTRQPPMFDMSKAEISDDDDTGIHDHIEALPVYMKAVCIKARSRNLAVKRLLKDMIDNEEAYIQRIGEMNTKYFPFQTCMIESEAKIFLANYKKEIGGRLRFHQVIQGRMKRQYNMVCDLLRGNFHTRKRCRPPPVLQCNLCLLNDDHVRSLRDSEMAVCMNRDCVFLTCMKCAYKIKGYECPGCRSMLALYPGGTMNGPGNFPISREDYRTLHGSLIPEMPLTMGQFTTSSTISVSANLVPSASYVREEIAAMATSGGHGGIYTPDHGVSIHTTSGSAAAIATSSSSSSALDDVTRFHTDSDEFE